MNNWANRLANGIFSLIYDRMTQQLMQVESQPCDEPYFQVNKAGREAGTKRFMWAHITSERLKGPPLIVCCFELTRGTDHLRKFYEDFKGYITCDAYVSYHVLGKGNANVIIICGWMMHLRRRFAKTLSLIDTEGLNSDSIEGLVENKVLKLIGKIYDEDELLKDRAAAAQASIDKHVLNGAMLDLLKRDSEEMDRRIKAGGFYRWQEEHKRGLRLASDWMIGAEFSVLMAASGMVSPVNEGGREEYYEGEGGAKLDSMKPKELSKLMPEQIKEALPDGWSYSGSSDGRFIHINNSNGNDRIRIDPPDKITQYPHIHLLHESGNSLDINGNIVSPNSPDGHIPR